MKLEFVHKNGKQFAGASGRVADGLLKKLMDIPDKFTFGTEKFEKYGNMPCFTAKVPYVLGMSISSDDELLLYFSPDDFVIVKR